MDEQYLTTCPLRNGSGQEQRKADRRTAFRTVPYLAGGLLPRPPPDGLPVWLGAFSSCVFIVFLLLVPRKIACAGPRRTSRTFDVIDSAERMAGAACCGIAFRTAPSFFGHVGLELPAQFVGRPGLIVEIIEQLLDIHL